MQNISDCARRSQAESDCVQPVSDHASRSIYDSAVATTQLLRVTVHSLQLRWLVVAVRTACQEC